MFNVVIATITRNWPHSPTHQSTDDRLDGYQKKKYVCKLVFIFLLGNDIDFGYQEAVNLLSSSKFSEKQIVSHIQTLKVYIHNV